MIDTAKKSTTRLQNYFLRMLMAAFAILPVMLLAAQFGQAATEEKTAVVKVLEIKDNVVPTSEYKKPSSGNRFACIRIIVDNSQGTASEVVDPLLFYVKDVQDNQYQAELGTNSIMGKGASITADTILEVGATAEGWVCFDLPISLDLFTMSLRHDLGLRLSPWIPLSEAGGTAEIEDNPELKFLSFSQSTEEPSPAPEPKNTESLRKDLAQMEADRFERKLKAIFNDEFWQAIEQENLDYAEDLLQQALRENLDKPGETELEPF